MVGGLNSGRTGGVHQFHASPRRSFEADGDADWIPTRALKRKEAHRTRDWALVVGASCYLAMFVWIYRSARSWLSASMMDLLMRAACVVRRAAFFESRFCVA